MVNPDLTLAQASQAFRDGRCPQVIMNSVCVENGKRFLFSSGEYTQGVDEADADRFDFFGTFEGRDVPLVTAARMSATFPYVSPIARIDDEPENRSFHFADGGYFDNLVCFRRSSGFKIKSMTRHPS